MSDQYISQLRAQQAHSMLFWRKSAAQLYLPKMIKSTTGEQVMVPDQQQAGLESQIYLQYFQPITSTLSAFSTTGIQNGATKLCQFQIRSSDLIVLDLYLELELNIPAISGSHYYSLMPGPLWLDRIEFSYNGGTTFQYLYGDMMFRNLLMSLPPEKLYNYALASGRWLNPPNIAPNYSVAVPAQTVSGGSTVASSAYTVGQSQAAVYTIFPYCPKTATTNYPDQTGLNSGYMKLRIPLVGWFGQQIGIFSFSWIDTGILYLDVYVAGIPTYQTANANLGTNPFPSLTNIQLVCRAVSFPDPAGLGTMGAAEKTLMVANKQGRGYHFAYVDYVRYLASAVVLTSSTTLGVTQQVYLDFTVGRHTAWLLLIARNKQAFTAGTTGWLLGSLNTADASSTALESPDPTLSGTTSGTNSKLCYFGTRTVFGDRSTSQVPACDILNTNNNLIFSSGGSIAIEQWQNMLAAKIPMPNNPWQMGVVGGSTTWAPLATNEIPMFFCNPINALQGVHDGSVEFPIQHKLQITYGANALYQTSGGSSGGVNDAITNFDVYAAQWRVLHLSTSANGPQIDFEPEPKHQRGDA